MFFIAEYSDGQQLSELYYSWENLPNKKDIIKLIISDNNNKLHILDIPKNYGIIQFKTTDINILQNSSHTVFLTVGFIKNEEGNCQLMIVDDLGKKEIEYKNVYKMGLHKSVYE